MTMPDHSMNIIIRWNIRWITEFSNFQAPSTTRSAKRSPAGWIAPSKAFDTLTRRSKALTADTIRYVVYRFFTSLYKSLQVSNHFKHFDSKFLNNIWTIPNHSEQSRTSLKFRMKSIFRIANLRIPIQNPNFKLSEIINESPGIICLMPNN